MVKDFAHSKSVIIHEILCSLDCSYLGVSEMYTLQGTNISHLGKRKIIFKSAFKRGYVSSLEGIHIIMILSYLTILTQCARILLRVGTSPDVIAQMQCGNGFLGAAHEKTI